MSVEIALYENVLSEGIKNEIDVVDVDVDDFELAIVCINGEALVLFNGGKISLCWILCIVWSDEKGRAGRFHCVHRGDHSGEFGNSKKWSIERAYSPADRPPSCFCHVGRSRAPPYCFVCQFI